MKKSGFTIVEIIIVITIMVIILGITMNFGSNRIAKLRYQSAKSQFVSNYENLYSYVLTTNYRKQKPFQNLKLTLKQDSNNFEYSYEPIESGFKQNISDNMFINNLKIN